ncbi:MAG: DUF1836 domain-containing protein [Lachnospiraceae bacterium]|nr:DUF1836 domain-containing protein [Lachnospiraceae bacterium]
MTLNTEDLLNSILESLSRIDYIKPSEIPNIDLYMDQVTTFMDSRLKQSKRNQDDDKILTKTMINNYAKNDLLPPPVKKKYSKEHVLLLIFIYYYKGIMSINDIQNLLCPITERFFGKKEGFSLEDLYNEVFSLEPGLVEEMKEDVKKKYLRAQNTFGEAPTKDQEFLKTFAFICMLSVDVYVKKLMIETLIDSLPKAKPDEAETKAESKKTESKKDNKKSETK